MGVALQRTIVEKVELAKKLEQSNLSMEDVPVDTYANSNTLVSEVQDKLTELSHSVRGKGMKSVKRIGKPTRRPSATPKSRAVSEAPSQIDVVKVKDKKCRLAEDEKPAAFTNLKLHIEELDLEKMCNGNVEAQNLIMNRISETRLQETIVKDRWANGLERKDFANWDPEVVRFAQHYKKGNIFNSPCPLVDHTDKNILNTILVNITQSP